MSFSLLCQRTWKCVNLHRVWDCNKDVCKFRWKLGLFPGLLEDCQHSAQDIAFIDYVYIYFFINSVYRVSLYDCSQGHSFSKYFCKQKLSQSQFLCHIKCNRYFTWHSLSLMLLFFGFYNFYCVTIINSKRWLGLHVYIVQLQLWGSNQLLFLYPLYTLWRYFEASSVLHYIFGP